jgi:hypothetical protein
MSFLRQLVEYANERGLLYLLMQVLVNHQRGVGTILLQAGQADKHTTSEALSIQVLLSDSLSYFATHRMRECQSVRSE